jgi:NAD(P)-dependent dehydrogenase (short-subunit alcohol dehydrogenase family)
MGRLDGKVALITGGSSGIGEAIAMLFAQEGAAVVVTGRRQEPLTRVVQTIERAGGRALAVAGSVADEAHVRTAVSKVVTTFGKLTTLINNAGIVQWGKRLHEFDDQAWDDMLAVNLTGVFRMTRAALPEMIQAGGGAVVNISSNAGLIAIPLNAPYCATKGGLNALTRCVAVDYARDGIRCNAVCPGIVETPLTEAALADPTIKAELLATYPLRRSGTPEEVARMVLYLASDEAAWVTGGIFPIDGGMTAGSPLPADSV